MKEKTWGDLFEYLEEKVNLHLKNPKDENSWTWTCKGDDDKSFVKEWCDENEYHFYSVALFLDFTGGHCDCEVLMNSTHKFTYTDPIGKMRTFKWEVRKNPSREKDAPKETVASLTEKEREELR